MTLAHDAGMQQLLQQLGQQMSAAPDDPPDAATGLSMPAGAAELDIRARLVLALEGNTSAMNRARSAWDVPWEVCHPIPLNPVTNTAAGVINDERWEPRQGFVWHILRVSVASNASGGATSALLVQDSAQVAGASDLQQFPPVGTAGTAGSFLGCWEPKGKFLFPGQRLILQTTGGGAIMNGDAIEIDTNWLSRYIM